MKKNLRHEKIIELISQQAIETQDELQVLLGKNGFDVTQATVSRDINRLGLKKGKNSEGRYCYIVDDRQADDRMSMLRSMVKSVDYAMNDVVVKCESGMAQAACVKLEEVAHDEVIGTVAGDDTILLIARDESAAKVVCELIANMIR